jgi:hypothetical protein
MFQLIVAVISIALVAALAIASIYYGGTAFQSSSLRANVTQLVNGGQQISGAQALYITDHGVPATNGDLSISGLESTYLTTDPTLPALATGPWQLLAGGTNGIAYAPFSAAGVTNEANICAEVQKQSGNGTNAQFYCSDATGAAGVAGFAFKL